MDGTRRRGISKQNKQIWQNEQNRKTKQEKQTVFKTRRRRRRRRRRLRQQPNLPGPIRFQIKINTICNKTYNFIETSSQ